MTTEDETPDIHWLQSFIKCSVFGPPVEAIERAHAIVTDLERDLARLKAELSTTQQELREHKNLFYDACKDVAKKERENEALQAKLDTESATIERQRKDAERYRQMMEAAEAYFRLLREPGPSAAGVDAAEARLNELAAPFSDDPAFQALLKLERESQRGGAAMRPVDKGAVLEQARHGNRYLVGQLAERDTEIEALKLKMKSMFGPAGDTNIKSKKDSTQTVFPIP